LANLHGDLTITNGFKLSMEVLFAEIEEILADTCVEAVAGFRCSLVEYQQREAARTKRKAETSSSPYSDSAGLMAPY